MNLHIIRFELRLNRLPLLFCAGGLLVFQFVFVAFYAATRPDETMTGLFDLVPQAFKNLVGGEYLDLLTISGFLAYGFTHPLNIFLFCTVAIALASRTASGGAEEGTTDLLLSQPLSRASLLASRMAAGACCCVVLVISMWLGHIVGVLTISLPATPERPPFVYAAVNALFFLFGIQSLAFLSAALVRLRSSAVGIAIFVIALMFFLRLAGELWDLFEVPALLSLFTYYVPGKVVSNASLPAGDLFVLALISVAASGLSFYIFSRKDI